MAGSPLIPENISQLAAFLPPAQPELDVRVMQAIQGPAEDAMHGYMANYVSSDGSPRRPLLEDIVTEEALEQAAEMDPIDLPDDVRIVYEANTLVEEGLDFYDEASRGFLQVPVFGEWQRNWVDGIGGERWHGQALHKVAEARGIYMDPASKGRRLAGFLANGLTGIDAGDISELLAFTTFQEPITELAHRELLRRIPNSSDEKLVRRTLGATAFDEGNHGDFNGEAVAAIFQLPDRSDRALRSMMLFAVARKLITFEMPGFGDNSDIPDAELFADAYGRSRILTLDNVVNGVIVPILRGGKDGKGKYGWDLEHTDLDESASAIRDIMLEKIVDLGAYAAAKAAEIKEEESASRVA